MEVTFGAPSDIDEWMRLVKKVRGNFPGLETEQALCEHRATVEKFMRRQNALCVKRASRVAGVLLFSPKRNMLCCMAVDPAFRRRHIGDALMARMLEIADPARPVVVSTFREGDPLGVAARAFYQKHGFAPGALTEDFGHPAQLFIRPAANTTKNGGTAP